MSTERLIPGGPYVNELAARQALIPGGPYLNESGPSGGGDTTAPILTFPTGTATGSTTANGSVTTNEGNGTLYRLASTNATESAATIKAAALTTTVTATGAQAVSFTGLTPATTYYTHFVHVDAALNESFVADAPVSFTTSGGTATLTSSALKDNTGTLHLSAPFEAFVLDATTGALVLRKTGLTSHASTGVVTFADAALTASTTYRVAWRQTTTGAQGIELLVAT